MEKIQAFIKSSWHEITKEVTWPSSADLRGSSTLVLVASLLFALLVGFMDFIFKYVLESIYKL
jgi:preprotein translocase subunit SecE